MIHSGKRNKPRRAFACMHQHCAGKAIGVPQKSSIQQNMVKPGISKDPPAIFDVAFSPANKLLAAATNQGRVKLWNAITHQQLSEVVADESGRICLAFSPDGKTLALGVWEDVQLWNVDNAGRPKQNMVGVHESFVECVAFAPNGIMFASAGAAPDIKLWNSQTGKEISSLNAHKSGVNALSFSDDGQFLASGGEDSTIKIWDLTKPGLVASYDVPQSSIEVPHLDEQGITFKAIHNSYVTALKFFPKAHLLAAGLADTNLIVMNVLTGQLTKSAKVGVVSSIAISGSKVLATCGGARAVCLWDSSTLLIRGQLHGHTNCVLSVAFCSQGSILASGSSDGTVRLWDAEREEMLTVLKIS